MDLPPFARLSPTGLSLFLKVTPNAGRNAIDGVETRDDGSAVLRIRVSAVPDKGKANAAVIALLARGLDLPRSALRVVSGETSRFKTVAVAGDVDALSVRFAALSSLSP